MFYTTWYSHQKLFHVFPSDIILFYVFILHDVLLGILNEYYLYFIKMYLTTVELSGTRSISVNVTLEFLKWFIPEFYSIFTLFTDALEEYSIFILLFGIWNMTATIYR